MTGNYSKVTHYFSKKNATVKFSKKIKKVRVVVLIFSLDSESVLEFFYTLRGKVRISNFSPQNLNKNSNTDLESTLKMSTTTLIFFNFLRIIHRRGKLAKNESLLNSYRSLVGKNINFFNNHFKHYSLYQHRHYKHTKTL